MSVDTLRYFLMLSASLLIAVLLSGCVAVAGGAVVTGAAVANDRRTSGTMVEDQSIELRAYSAIRKDTEINEQAHINVTSYNQIVLLTGEAPTEELRQRVVEHVRSVREVKKIYNEIALAAPSSLGSRSSDTLITTKVKTKLFATRDLDATRVKVITERGIVYLFGLLSAEEADRATEATRTVGGVQKVVKLFEPFEEQTQAEE
ncbi:MAG: BON domain-containing protein [Gammaproteobacteria bacterium]